MIVESKEFTLKDGRKGLLRCADERDALTLIDIVTTTCGETNFLMKTPEECKELDFEKEKKFVEDINEDKAAVFLTCEVDGKIVGDCELRAQTLVKTRHRAGIGIGILKEYWGLGIGTAMFERLIELAYENKYIEQLELDFVEGNARGRALYEKMGFRITAVKNNAIRLPDGTHLNEYSMIKVLER